MNAGYYLARWVLKQSKSKARSALAAALGYSAANWLVNFIFSKGSAWGAARVVGAYAGRIAAAGGFLGSVIGVAAGAM